MGTSFLYNAKLKPRARELRKAGNLAEVLMWKQLQNRKMCGLLFNRQKCIGNFIADFACESHRIIIEVDGNSHIWKEEYDAERDAILRATGFRVIHITDKDVKFNMDKTLHYLQSKIQAALNSPLN